MDRALHYFWFADRFGWTKTQVDGQPSAHLRRLRAIGETLTAMQDEANRAR